MDVKTWLQSRQVKLGTILTIDHPAIIEIAVLAGFDWLWIDGEHGSFNEVSAATACAVNASRLRMFVRLPDRSGTAVRRFLEIGCDGIIVPQVSSVAEVDEVARAAFYPPRGERGIGIARAQGYGARFAEYLQKQDFAVVVQIETAAGVENAQAIIEHSAVNAVLIGPYDMSASFGIPGQVEAPPVLDGIAKVQSLCRTAGKPCGIFAGTAEKAQAFAAAGFDLIAIGMDCTTLLEGFRSLHKTIA